MSLETAARFSEILLALALIQQSLEHLRGGRDEQLQDREHLQSTSLQSVCSAPEGAARARLAAVAEQ